MATREIKVPVKWCEKMCGRNMLENINVENLTWFSDTETRQLIGIYEYETEPMVRIVVVAPPYMNGNPLLLDYTFNPDTITKRTDGLTAHWIKEYERLGKRASQYGYFVSRLADWKRREPMYPNVEHIEKEHSEIYQRLREIEQAYRQNPEWIALNKRVDELKKERMEILYSQPLQSVFVQQ